MKKLSQLAFILTMIMSLSLFTGVNTINAQVGDTDNDNGSCVDLQYNMRYRMRDVSVNNEVSDLQDYLIAEGYLSGNTTGFFGVATLKAVKSFQAQNGLISSGYVGPVTRAKIKSLSCDTANNYNNSDPAVILGPGNGTISANYYYLNSNKNACSKGIFIGNVGPLISNGQYVYQTGQYKTEAECKSANGLSYNSNTGSGTVYVTYYSYNTVYKMCTESIYMGNTGERVLNGQYVYRAGEHKTEAECKSANGISSSLSSVRVSGYKDGDVIQGQPARIIFVSDKVMPMNSTGYIDFISASTGLRYSIYNISYAKGENYIEWKDTTKTQSVNGSYSVDMPAGIYTPVYNLADGNKVTGQNFKIVSTSKKISISSATLKEFDANNINLMIYGTGFKNGASININGCSAGGVSSLSSNSDTETSASFDKAYLLGCITHGTYINVYIAGNGTDNSNTYSVYVPMMSVKPTVTSSFSSNQLPGYTIASAYLYQIQNYRDGLVLDVELRTADCLETGGYRKDCSKYLFNLSGKAAETYSGVGSDPYVKGGSGYRFTGSNGQINITSFQDLGYVPVYPYTNPIPLNIYYKFVLRDTKNGGAEVWSETKSFGFPG